MIISKKGTGKEKTIITEKVKPEQDAFEMGNDGLVLNGKDDLEEGAEGDAAALSIPDVECSSYEAKHNVILLREDALLAEDDDFCNTQKDRGNSEEEAIVEAQEVTNLEDQKGSEIQLHKT